MKSAGGLPVKQEPVKILHLEDNLLDAELVKEMLLGAGLNAFIARVDSKDQFIQALGEREFDLILSDFTLPSFDGAAALRLAQAQCPDTPFIYFSGTIGEEAAVEALISGATDYVIKTRPKRFIPAVRRALKEAHQNLEKRKLEQQFLQAQKMEGIGRLAGGIAHDFNNLLTAIIGYGQLLRDQSSPDDPNRQDLDEIIKAGHRAALLTRQLLAFSRKQALQPRVININAQVSEMGRMLERILGEDINLIIIPERDLKYVRVDPSQLEQVIMNLAVNARDAMPKGGKLTIETQNRMGDATYVEGHEGMKPGDYVLLAISDTGLGMTPEVQAKIFEPFFTTKEIGHGTGLGLSTVYGIVKQSAGYISVHSELGHGTTFHIYLPQVAEGVEQEEAVPPRPVGLEGSETILVVEDEETVRIFLKRVLENYGYTVLEARHGQDALSMLDAATKPIPLIVTDMIMPGMSGVDLVKRVKATSPDIKALYISGYTEVALGHQDELASHFHFLHKPFVPEAFVQKIRQILDGTK